MSVVVTNSVKQIKTECDQLINVAGTLPYIDVGIMARDLKDMLKELTDFFDSYPEKERELNMKKTMVEIKAIQLEHLIQCRVNEFRERHKLRGFSTLLLEDVRSVFKDKVKKIKETGTVVKKKDDVNVDALLWSDYFNYAVKLYNRSNHILFEIDNEDERMIKLITEEIKTYRGE